MGVLEGEGMAHRAPVELQAVIQHSLNSAAPMGSSDGRGTPIWFRAYLIA